MDVPLFGGDVPNLPPNELSPTSHGGFAVAIYVLSAVGLILFIVVMVLYIITWSRRTKVAEKISEANKVSDAGTRLKTANEVPNKVSDAGTSDAISRASQAGIGADYKTAGAKVERSAQRQERNLEPPFLAPGSIQ